MRVEEFGSVRIDLLGGTLDLEPINIILPHAYTLNLATSLQAHVVVEKSDDDLVVIKSLDYQSKNSFKKEDFKRENLDGNFFGPLSLVAEILNHFSVTSHVTITLKSGSPAGAGLGGSSAMAITLYKALARYTGTKYTQKQALFETKLIEAQKLSSGPTGYQDYYPALFGGVLALKPSFRGVEVEQLYNEELKKELESSLTLVFSGQTRMSGMNNWEVYKAFFDQNKETNFGLKNIAELSFKAYQCIKNSNYQELKKLIQKEGEERVKLFPGIMTGKMNDFLSEAKKISSDVGMKVCGAGGGGCFILIHRPDHKLDLLKLIEDFKMDELSFSIEKPIS